MGDPAPGGALRGGDDSGALLGRAHGALAEGQSASGVVSGGLVPSHLLFAERARLYRLLALYAALYETPGARSARRPGARLGALRPGHAAQLRRAAQQRFRI